MRRLEQADSLFRVDDDILSDVLQSGREDGLFTFGADLLTSIRKGKSRFYQMVDQVYPFRLSHPFSPSKKAELVLGKHEGMKFHQVGWMSSVAYRYGEFDLAGSASVLRGDYLTSKREETTQHHELRIIDLTTGGTLVSESIQRTCNIRRLLEEVRTHKRVLIVWMGTQDLEVETEVRYKKSFRNASSIREDMHTVFTERSSGEYQYASDETDGQATNSKNKLQEYTRVEDGQTVSCFKVEYVYDGDLLTNEFFYGKKGIGGEGIWEDISLVIQPVFVLTTYEYDSKKRVVAEIVRVVELGEELEDQTQEKVPFDENIWRQRFQVIADMKELLVPDIVREMTYEGSNLKQRSTLENCIETRREKWQNTDKGEVYYSCIDYETGRTTVSTSKGGIHVTKILQGQDVQIIVEVREDGEAKERISLHQQEPFSDWQLEYTCDEVDRELISAQYPFDWSTLLGLDVQVNTKLFHLERGQTRALILHMDPESEAIWRSEIFETEAK